jgi:predicted Zn-dependent peptidase
MPILALDEMIARIDAVDAEQVGALAQELLDPERLSAVAIGPDEAAFTAALEPLLPALSATP